jgi:HD superfamily phosphohydrolase
MIYHDKLYGTVELPQVIEDLMNTAVFQRLKNIHQGGAIFLVNPKLNHTRFEHSIGVMLLIKHLGGSLEEQIAGLLHDISHTAFSHLIDYVLDIGEEDYHEKRFEEVINDVELKEVLEKHTYAMDTFLYLDKFKLLEYPLPYLCADRIDYTLRDLFQLEVISKKEIEWFMSGMVVFENRIVLNSKEHGRWFQSKYSYLVSEYFNGQENKEINLIMKMIIKDGFQKGIITERDFFQDDFYLLKK